MVGVSLQLPEWSALTASCPGGSGGGTLRRVSGFAGDPKYYGDRLLYEPLESKWAGYHARHCGCGHDWLEAHEPPRV